MNERRIKILTLLSEGYVPKEIAQKLSISMVCIYDNFVIIKRELEAKTMEQAIRRGIEKEYIVGIKLRS